MFPRLSGATIRDTLIGVLRPLLKTQTPDKTTEPTKAHVLLLLQRKGKDSKKPSMRPTRGSPSDQLANLRLARGQRIYPRAGGQSPPRSRVADLPSSGWPISASLEGSGSTLERVANLRLARGQRIYPRAGGQSPPRSRPSLGIRDKRPRRPTNRRTKALKASHSTTAQRTGGG